MYAIALAQQTIGQKKPAAEESAAPEGLKGKGYEEGAKALKPKRSGHIEPGIANYVDGGGHLVIYALAGQNQGVERGDRVRVMVGGIHELTGRVMGSYRTRCKIKVNTPDWAEKGEFKGLRASDFKVRIGDRDTWPPTFPIKKGPAEPDPGGSCHEAD